MNSLQNEPIISKQKLKIVKISQIIGMEFLFIAYNDDNIAVYTLNLVYFLYTLNTQHGRNI